MTWPLIRFEEVALQRKGAIVSGPFGSNIGSRFFVDQGVPVIRGNNLTFGERHFIDDGFVFLTEEKAREFNNCQAVAGDLVFTAAGTIGQVGIIPSDAQFERYIISNKQLRVRCDHERVDPLFLFLWFTTDYMRQYIVNQNRGTSIPLINLGTLRNLPVPFPPLKVQQRIAGIVSAYDDLIENNRRRMALLEEAARLLYQEWFVHLRFPSHEHTTITNGIPEGWSKASAFDAMHVMSGGTPKTTNPDFWDGEIPFYTPKDSVTECYVLDTEKHVTELGLSKCNSRLYPKDTIFITARGTVGNLNLAQRSMAMNQSCYALAGKDDLPQKILFCALLQAIQHFKQHAIGAVFDAIIVDTFKLIPFIIPDRRLVGLFEDSVEPIFQLIENLLLQNRQLRAARDLLLPRLMNGAMTV